MELTTEQRKDLVTSRESLRRAALGDDNIDFGAAASMLDRVLASSCPHDESDHYETPDVTNGRPLVTCRACRVSWYADYHQRLSHT